MPGCCRLPAPCRAQGGAAVPGAGGVEWCCCLHRAAPAGGRSSGIFRTFCCLSSQFVKVKLLLLLHQLRHTAVLGRAVAAQHLHAPCWRGCGSCCARSATAGAAPPPPGTQHAAAVPAAVLQAAPWLCVTAPGLSTCSTRPGAAAQLVCCTRPQLRRGCAAPRPPRPAPRLAPPLEGVLHGRHSGPAWCWASSTAPHGPPPPPPPRHSICGAPLPPTHATRGCRAPRSTTPPHGTTPGQGHAEHHENPRQTSTHVGRRRGAAATRRGAKTVLPAAAAAPQCTAITPK